MKVIQGVIPRADAVIGQTGTLFQNNFPGPAILAEDIIADTVLPFIGVGAFGSDTADFIDKHVTHILAFLSGQNLALGSALHFAEFRHHLPVSFDAVFQKRAFVIGKDDQFRAIMVSNLFRLSAIQGIHFFQDIGEGLDSIRKSLICPGK